MSAAQEIVDRMERSTRVQVLLAFSAIELVILQQVWGRWPVVTAVIALGILTYCFNAHLMHWLRRRGVTAERAESVRTLGNLLILLALGWLIHWHIAIWALLVFTQAQCALLGGVHAARRFLLSSIGFVPAALALGAGGAMLVLSVTTAYSLSFVIERVTRHLAQMVEEREAQRKELEAAHTELIAMQQTAVRQEKLAGLGMLAAGIAHEINNPMSYVTSNVSSLLEDLRREPALSAGLREYQDDVLPATLDGIRRVNSIVADLRRFAHGDVGETVTFDLNEEIQAAIRLTQGRLKNRCEVRVDLRELPSLRGRPRQIAQVLVNLLVNAAQAIRDSGTVEIASWAREGEVSFSVKDDGCGMDEATIGRLFQPFFTTKPVGEGTGLGLSVIHGIVTEHGGRIDVESAPGQGSRFTVTLPCLPPERAPEPAANPPTGSWRLDALLAHGHGRLRVG